MNAIILCGGLSTRLGDITKATPKVLLDIKGQSVLEWQIEKLKTVGITEVVLAAGHLNEVLFAQVGLHLGGVTLTYAIEQERLGTGGAIKHAWEYVAAPREPAVVLNGDVLTTVDLATMARRLNPQSDGLILGSYVPDAAPYGTLVYDPAGRLTEFKEKAGRPEPGYINGGIYIFNERARKYWPNQSAFSIEYDIFPRMTDLYVYLSDEPWVDIGVPEWLNWAREHWPG